jgi:nucleoside-diphosphate-sugar epimerase
VRQLVETIAGELGNRTRRPSLPKGLVWAGCLIFESAGKLTGREPSFSRRSLKFFTESSSFDISRARQKLDFCPRTRLQEGVRATLDYYRAHDELD